MTALEKLFTLELPDGMSLGHQPGQFVEVSVLGRGRSADLRSRRRPAAATARSSCASAARAT